MANRRLASWKGFRTVLGWALVGWFVSLCQGGGSPAQDAQQGAVPAADSAATDVAAADAAAMVKQLGDPVYAKRREAADRLTALGLLAEISLRQGIKHGDPEIARRCRWLLAEMKTADLRRRIDAFAADKEGKLEHRLPFFEEYRKICGDDRASRDLYLEMLKAEGLLMEVASQGEASTNQAIQARYYPLFEATQRGQGIEKPIAARNLAAWMLVGAGRTAKAPVADEVMQPGMTSPDLVMNVIEQNEFKKWLERGSSREPLRKLFVHWLLIPTQTDQVQARLRLAMRYDLKESLTLAAFILQSREGSYFDHAMCAAAAIGRFGGKDHAAMLEPLLAKESATTTWGPGNQRRTVQLRDVALAWLVELTEQDHAAYGMPDFKAKLKQVKANPQVAFDAQCYGFYVESTRAAAMEKWRDYAAKNPLPKSPEVELPPGMAALLKKSKEGMPNTSDAAGYRPGATAPALGPVAPQLVPGQLVPAPPVPGQPVPVQPVPVQPVPVQPVPVQPVPVQQPCPIVVPEGEMLEGEIPEGEMSGDVPPEAAEGGVANPGEIQANAVQAWEGDSSEETQDESRAMAEDAPIANLRADWADRDSVRKLKAAADLCALKRFGQAARLLDEILEEPAGKLFVRSQKRRAASNLQVEAEQVLAALPPEGLQAYQTQSQTKSRRMLAEAAAAGDAAQVALVADRYFFTPAGAEAALLAAIMEMDRGDWARAAARLSRLRRQSPDAKRLEPQLSLRAAGCMMAQGDVPGALRLLGELESNYPGIKPMIAGRVSGALPTGAGQRRWLESVFGERSAAIAPVDASAVRAGVPLPRGKRLDVPGYDSIPTLVRDKIEKKHRDSLAASLPGVRPLLIGHRAAFRTPTRLAVVDVKSGSLLWDSLLEDPLRWFLEGRKVTDKAAADVRVVNAAKGRLFGDLKYGMISSDGQRVFGIEGIAVELPSVQRIEVMPDGQFRLEAGGPRDFNLLTAYDLQTGKLVWSLGGPPEADGQIEMGGLYPMGGQPLAPRRFVAGGQAATPKANVAPSHRAAGGELDGASFLGTPLCWGGRLLVVVAVKSDISLAEIDASTGKVLDVLPLAAIETTSEDYGGPCSGDELARALRGGLAQGCAYEDGVVVCGIGEGRFAAVDIVRRKLLWAYSLPEEMPASSRSLAMWLDNDEVPQEESPAGWLDTSVVLAAGFVALMPAGADRLDVVNLASGQLAWSRPREDGVYCAATPSDCLLIIGRGGVRALRASSGKPLWDGRRIDYPSGVVCGRGYMSEAGYCIPISSGEILIVDCAKGRVVGRSRASGGSTPGNLLACGETVLSCGADGARLFPVVFGAQLPEAVAAAGDDPARLLDAAERLLAIGRSAEAAAALKRCVEAHPSKETQQMLGEAILDGLLSDDAVCGRLALECEPLLSGSENWRRIAWEIAAGAERQGRRVEAFDAYVRFIDGQKKPEEPMRIDALRTASALSRGASRLEDLYRAAADAERAAMDERIAPRWSNADLRGMIARFGWHPSAPAKRLELAGKVMEAKSSSLWSALTSAMGNTPQDVKRLLEADFALRRVLSEGSPQQQHEAAARLASLFATAHRVDEAAWWYQRLATEMGDAECLDGKTGKELFDAIKADSLIRTALQSKLVWPTGKVEVETTKQPGYLRRDEGFYVSSSGGRIEPCSRVVMDRGSNCVGMQDAHGRSAWATTVTRPESGLFEYPYYEVYEQPRGVWVGNLLVVSFNGAVCGLDGYGRTEPVWAYARKTSETPRMYQEPAQRDPFQAPAAQPLAFAASWRAVCFFGKQGLSAVDPLSGKVLWTRDDMPLGSDLTGDDEFLMVTPPESEEAFVLRVCDGRDAGRRRVGAIENRLCVLGRKAVSFTAGDERPNLARVDVWSGETLWKRSFANGAKAWLIADDEAAVMDREGNIVFVRLSDGKDAMTAKADPAEKLESICVLRGADRYVVIANGAVSWAKGVTLQNMGEELIPVNGRVYGFARPTGKRLWTTNVIHQAMRPGQDPELPILAFACCGQRTVEENKQIWYQMAQVLDVRTGETLYRRMIDRHYSSQSLGVQAELEEKKIKIGSDWGTITLTFTDTPR